MQLSHYLVTTSEQILENWKNWVSFSWYICILKGTVFFSLKLLLHYINYWINRCHSYMLIIFQSPELNDFKHLKRLHQRLFDAKFIYTRRTNLRIISAWPKVLHLFSLRTCNGQSRFVEILLHTLICWIIKVF